MRSFVPYSVADERCSGAVCSKDDADPSTEDFEPQYEAIPSYLVWPDYVLTDDEKFSISSALDSALEDFQTRPVEPGSLRLTIRCFESGCLRLV